MPKTPCSRSQSLLCPGCGSGYRGTGYGWHVLLQSSHSCHWCRYLDQLLRHLYPHENPKLVEYLRGVNSWQSPRLFGLGCFWSFCLHGWTLCPVPVHDGLAAPTFLRHPMDLLRWLQSGGVQNVTVENSGQCPDNPTYNPIHPIHQLCHAVFWVLPLLLVEHPSNSRSILVGHQTSTCF